MLQVAHRYFGLRLPASALLANFHVLLLIPQPGQYGKKNHSQNATTLLPKFTTATSCSTIKEKFVIKLNGAEMPGCPAPVNNLTVTGKTNSSVTLAWESPPCPPSACRTNTTNSQSTNCVAHFSHLQPGQNYTIVLHRVTEPGGSNQSTSVDVTTLPEPFTATPSVPTYGTTERVTDHPGSPTSSALRCTSSQPAIEQNSLSAEPGGPVTSVPSSSQSTPHDPISYSTVFQGSTKPFTNSSDWSGVIISALFAVLILLFLLGLLLLFYFRRRNEKVLEKLKATAGPPCVLASVSVSTFPCYCCEHFSDSAFGFAKEYQQLQDMGTGQPQTVAELPRNRDKNRYTNVLPYDSSRVKLSPNPSDPNSDYINASYMPGYHGEKEYIAAQGPLPGTVHDFWRMIWEQRVTTLVMLTNCTENGRVKCERYWPLDYIPCTYDDITVSVAIETILLDWTIRDFTIKRKNECEVRLARHYHYTSWPDHGVPTVTSAILHFRDLVRKHIEQHVESGPALVHCSAGVGRTGTFIALDTLLSQAQKEGRIGVYSFVQRLRMNRPLMIQTESQYVFLHQCLLDRIQPPLPDMSEQMQCTAVYENTLAFQDYEVSRV
ncbi:receptor-type tyrosine-protein phosphatase H [Heteronotia binoei]|uniref:receptor-type tyrosine-protein phosphatase H n=1 Tax=Heteronotia binoei TaxID=13085 RepID=UPI002930C31E|nr:receptor-type tyrosine-protein phosphatase H [Heteronotia binoei]